MGDPVAFFGTGFVDRQDGWTDVHFSGVFTPKDGSPANDVDLTIPLQVGLDGALNWRFGGYRVPFLPAGNKLGVFDGRVWATNHFYNPNQTPIEQEAEPLDVTFHVNPSLVVLDNRAFGDDFIADCVEPSTVLLQTMRYAFRVKALGFDPARFDFVTTEGLLRADLSRNVWVVQTEPDAFGYEADGNDEFAIVHRWAPAPTFTTGYQAGITAAARGVGMEKRVHFPFIVRPWTYAAFETPGQVAELLPPTQITGCIPGGPSSLGTTYEESVSETKMRSISTAISRGFERSFQEAFTESYDFSESVGFSETESQSTTIGNTAEIGASTSVTDMFSATNTLSRDESFNWERDERRGTTGVYTVSGNHDTRTDDFENYDASDSGGFSPFIFNFGTQTSNGGSGGTAVTIGSQESQATSQERAISNDVGGSVSFGEQYAETVSQSRQRGRTWGFSRSFQEQVGFSMTRSLNQTQTFGQALQTTQALGESLGTTESEVVTQSSTETISRGLSGTVWANQQGMWFRQTTRIVHFGAVIALDLCGNGAMVGEVQASSWKWAADLGIGDTCPPASNFPPAECRIQPCTF